MTKAKQAERHESLDMIRKFVSPGDTVYCVLKHASRSGMSREISFYAIKDNQPRYLSGYIGQVLGYRRGKHDGLIVGGCGMDMGFHVVYSLSRSLFPDGVPCVGDRCLSNDHSNGDRDRTTPKTHKDGGYALSSRWI